MSSEEGEDVPRPTLRTEGRQLMRLRELWVDNK